MNDSSQNGYSQSDWQGHYDSGECPWDLGEVAPPFRRLLEEGRLNPGSLIVPGCGRGHEVLYFARNGFDVTAVDYTEGAVTTLGERLREQNIQAQVLRQSFFDLDTSHDKQYDMMLEQTFFCAIHPDQRADYVATASRILKQGGRLFGLFYETGEEGGPPFNTTEQNIHDQFSDRFRVFSLEKCDHSIERRQGKEWLAILEKL